MATHCVRVGADASIDRYSPTTNTVVHNLTNLEWQAVPANGYTFANAMSYCDALALDGTGWRAPSIQELESIVDTSQPDPLIDPIAFPGTPSAIFWSSSPLVTDLSMGWSLDFSFGYAFRPQTSQLRIRCVR